jgi:hypothetical protein
MVLTQRCGGGAHRTLIEKTERFFDLLFRMKLIRCAYLSNGELSPKDGTGLSIYLRGVC